MQLVCVCVLVQFLTLNIAQLICVKLLESKDKKSSTDKLTDPIFCSLTCTLAME